MHDKAIGSGTGLKMSCFRSHKQDILGRNGVLKYCSTQQNRPDPDRFA